MHAAILNEAGGSPRAGDFEDPSDGQAVLAVHAAGANPVDLMMASGNMGEVTVPSVVGREAVGELPEGSLVYSGSPVAPYGTWAERVPIDPDSAFAVPDGLDPGLAVAMGIAGLAAWLPLQWQAKLARGESVLVLGATGVVGQIAVQAARILGAGRVVGAGRDADALERLAGSGADATVTLGGGSDDAAALKDASGQGFDVVIDPVYGPPMVAALAATASGARIVTIGAGAGMSAEIPFGALMGRTHIGHGNQFAPREVQRDAYEQLTRHAAAGDIRLEVETYPLDRAADAWEAQAAGPHKKIVVVP